MLSVNKLKIIELASVLAGPAVGQFFAELGAEVIKIENQNAGGDVTRSWRAQSEKTDDRSAYFSCVNWGKKSVAFDLKDDFDRSHLYRLIANADIVIASFKPGDAQKLGVDFETLRGHNGRLIYGEVTGYGAGDDRVGYDAVIQAESGFMSMNGELNGPALKMPVALMDLLAAHQLKEGLLLALIEREHTGLGRKVEVSLFDAAISSLANQASNWLVGRSMPLRQGSLHPNIAPYGEVLTTKDDKQLLLAVGNDKQFNSLLDVLGLDSISRDERFINNENRVKNRTALWNFLADAASRMDSPMLLENIRRKKIPAGVISDLGDALQSQHAVALSLHEGSMQGLRTLVARFDGAWLNDQAISGPPHLGQHTNEVLRAV